MTTIGVYDSGIGGLTTLKLLLARFPFCDFYYLADNKNMPFGQKSKEELEDITCSALKKLRAHSDIQVFACNTASTTLVDAIKLVPPAIPNSLVLATPRTIESLKERAEYKTANLQFADTEELASLVETLATVSARKNCLNMQDAIPYLAKRIFAFKGVQNVVLGCSHYMFLTQEISNVLGAVNFFDGNEHLLKEVENALQDEPRAPRQATVKFDFTLCDESKKYQKIFSLLKNRREF